MERRRCSTSRPTISSDRPDGRSAPDNNFSVVRAQKEVGRSSYGGDVRRPLRHRRRRLGVSEVEPRLRRRRQHPADDQPAVLARLFARTDIAGHRAGQRLLRPRASTTSPTTSGRSRAATRRSASASTPRSGSCRAAATGGPSSARSSSRSRRTSSGSAASRRTIPYNCVLGLRRQAAELEDAHPPVRDPAGAGRPLRLVHRPQPGQSDGALRGLQPGRPARRRSRPASTRGTSTRSSTTTTPAPASPAPRAYASGTTTTATSSRSS